MKTLYTKKLVKSDRIIHTPSAFARSSLLYLQEIGRSIALGEHVSSRSSLQSYLFFIVMEGSGKLTYENREFRLSEGTCVFINCQKPYSHKTDSDNLWTLNWCHFYGVSMPLIYEKYIERGGKPTFKPDDLTSFLKILDILFTLDYDADHILDMKINEGLASLCTLLMAESWHPEDAAELSKKKASAISVKGYLDQHYPEKITLDSLSRSFYINKYYLTRVFKEKFGLSITAYLQSIRITHAKQMLRFSDKSVEQIGMECGIGSLHYFSKVFKEVEGIAPSVYRSQW